MGRTLAAWGLAVAVIAACSFEPSGTAPIDSRPNTIDGGGDAEITSADGASADAVTCTAGNCGGSCMDGTCVITCTGDNACDTVNCPPGIPCEVHCTGGGSGTGCNTVNCAPGQPCTVTCFGGPGVAAGGGAGCGSVNCNNACSCEVSCIDGTGAAIGGGTGCQQTSCLPGCDQGNGCELTPASSCDTC
jgi:hypothetical protein